MEEVAGDASLSCVPREKIVQFLEEVEEGREVDLDRLLAQLKFWKKNSSWSGWASSTARSWYRSLRLKLPGSYSYSYRLCVQLQEEMETEQKERAQKKAQKAAQQALARRVPERSTDFAVQVLNQLTSQLSMLEVETPISNDDTLNDVFSRYVDALKKGPGAEMPDAQLYAGVNQPSWLVVQRGGRLSKEGFAVQNFDLLVSDLEITAKDRIVFMSHRLKEDKVFFRTYSRKEAIKIASEMSR
eukprot:gnl/TRDRNA2_/TRDRNA2_175694_c0_seq6.p1 gnl/TRDRNA2_/TRDRNA2_175694_c0~~gnl/TRDRNA2_/TRDRNA2_175694_c0_seq6.p1  ORF type:complete len:243 (-),score=52.73 gnl/TRDRNA2_/TRDRNA2_175694_c0_seq6:33-761(-)